MAKTEIFTPDNQPDDHSVDELIPRSEEKPLIDPSEPVTPLRRSSRPRMKRKLEEYATLDEDLELNTDSPYIDSDEEFQVGITEGQKGEGNLTSTVARPKPTRTKRKRSSSNEPQDMSM